MEYNLDRFLTLSVLEKNNLYHQILRLVRASNSSEQTAATILQTLTEFLEDKKLSLTDFTTSTTTSPTKTGKVFRRVG